MITKPGQSSLPAPSGSVVPGPPSSKYVQQNTIVPNQSSPPDYYGISHSALAPGTPPIAADAAGQYPQGLYIGVPNDFKTYSGDVPGQYLGPGYGMGGGSIVAQPTYRYPIYTYDYREQLRGVDRKTALQWQDALRDAGYLAAGHRSGTFDQATYDAAGLAMADANESGKTLNELFQDAALSQSEWDKAHPTAKKPPSPARDITSSAITLTGRAGAQSVLTNALATELGREPTAYEIDRFMRSLNSEERASPSVTHTHIGVGGNTESSTTTQSNVDPSASADAWARTNQATQGERQAYRDSNYFDVLNQMLSAGG